MDISSYVLPIVKRRNIKLLSKVNRYNFMDIRGNIFHTTEKDLNGYLIAKVKNHEIVSALECELDSLDKRKLKEFNTDMILNNDLYIDFIILKSRKLIVKTDKFDSIKTEILRNFILDNNEKFMLNPISYFSNVMFYKNEDGKLMFYTGKELEYKQEDVMTSFTSIFNLSTCLETPELIDFTYNSFINFLNKDITQE